MLSIEMHMQNLELLQFTHELPIFNNSLQNIRQIRETERKAHFQAKHYQTSNFTPLKNYIGKDR